MVGNSISRIDQQLFLLFFIIIIIINRLWTIWSVIRWDFTLIFFLKKKFLLFSFFSSSSLSLESLEKGYFTFSSRVHFKIKFRHSLYRCPRVRESFIRHLRDWIIIAAPKKNLNYDDPYVALIIGNVAVVILEFPRGIFATVYLHHPQVVTCQLRIS